MSFAWTPAWSRLLKAAMHENSDADVDVRYSALEAISVLAHNLGPEELAGRDDVMQTLIEASSEMEPGLAGERRRGELRGTAAFALGVIGGPKALDRLEKMLVDPHPNTRFNAATGLARHGDLRAEPVLREMLDPENPLSVEGKHRIRSESGNACSC